MTTSWCDKLASTPSVGFRLNKKHIAGDTLANAVSPILDRLSPTENAPNFTVESKDTFSLVFSTEDGFYQGVTQSRVYVEFRHRLKVVQNQGSIPVITQLSEEVPYTTLLPTICQKLMDLTKAIDPKGERTFDRVGIVSATTFELSDAPPGISKLIKYVGEPWGQIQEGWDFRFTSVVNKNDKWEDQCVHHVRSLPQQNGLVTAIFDFQRTYADWKPSALQEDSLRTTQRSALEYFETLAEGRNLNVNNLA